MKVLCLRKLFEKLFFASEDVLPVSGFLKTYIMMVTNMDDYLTLDLDDDDAKFR